jgi:hypothetical protein
MRILVVVCALAAATSGAVAKPPEVQPVSLPVNLPVIEVLDPSGAVTQAAVREAIAKIEAELAQCAADEKWKGDALAWIVSDWHGKVTKLELAVDKPAIERCFTKSLKGIVIAKAQGRATMMLRLRVGT